jgi:hypothetical protein
MTYQCWAEEPQQIVLSVANVIGMGGCDSLDVFGFFVGGTGGGVVGVVG